MKGVKKTHLPQKVCPICNRSFSWRKKWEKVWNEVTNNKFRVAELCEKNEDKLFSI